MKLFSRIAIFCALMAVVPLPRVLAQPASTLHLLSNTERTQAVHTSRLAVRSPRVALNWIAHQRGVAVAQLGRDGSSIQVRFRDGAEFVVLPKTVMPTTVSADLRSLLRHVPSPHQRDTAAGARAAVLLPFADELKEGPNAGQAESTVLKAAGFQVETYLNRDVTVSLLEHLADYSAVYMETHSGLLSNGDAIVNTAETDISKYKDLYNEHSVVQALSAGASELYVAVVSKFVDLHVGRFRDSSFFFLNGCDLLPATVFWGALSRKNLFTMISWDNHIDSQFAITSAAFMFNELGKGSSVGDAYAAAKAAGQATGPTDDGGTANLGFLGDGSVTLTRARDGAPAPVQATATPTATPTPAATDTATATPQPTVTPASPSLNFDSLAVVDASGHRPRRFRVGTLVYSEERFTGKSIKGTGKASISQTYAYWRSSKARWVQGDRPLLQKSVPVMNGHHSHRIKYQIPAALSPAYTRIRIAVSVTFHGKQQKRTAVIAITR